jgi:hypothetical protein
MIKTRKTWRKKWLAKEENSIDSSEGTSERGSNGGSLAKVDDGEQMSCHTETMEVNMVFTIPREFWAPGHEVAAMDLGPEKGCVWQTRRGWGHMKPLFIKGHINGRPVRHMMVDDGDNVNIMPTTVFKKKGHREEDLKQTNLSLSDFLGEPAKERGILSVELTVDSKIIPIAFFVVEVKGRYNVLLGHDLIRTNECVPSTLHQCVVQWVSDQVEVIGANEEACIAAMESQVDVQGGLMKCLTGRDLAEYDYVSIGKDGFVLISVKPTRSMTQLNNNTV